jgi:Flp pilus assembly CpaE family ATPase
MEQSTVVLGVADPALQEEVLHFLDRRPEVRVLATTTEGSDLGRELRIRKPTSLVVSPEVLVTAPDLDGAQVLVVTQRETTESLRAALRSGARGFYVWPEERDGLALGVERTRPPRAPMRRSSAPVIAVLGPRGGAGCTFLATNLAAALSDRGAEVVLADLDLSYGEVATALAVPDEPPAPTITDLIPVLSELDDDHLDRVLYAHPRGFRSLLAPAEPPAPRTLSTDAMARLVRALRGRSDVLILHLPRAFDGPVAGALAEADRVLLVITLDVLALKAARRALARLEPLGIRDACRLVINRASRGEIVPKDAADALGVPVVSVIRGDRNVERAQNRGELVAGRSGPAARGVGALARALMEETSE